MSTVIPVRAVLMSADIQAGGHGFHRLAFRVDGGRRGMANVMVLISQDAHRKLVAQLTRGNAFTVEKPTLLKLWARWAIALRLEETGIIPSAITITSSDLDDFGAYAMDFAGVLRAS
jgi:hypothetical protein